MTMEQEHNTLKEQLTTLGYSNVQVESAVTAGFKDINQAVDYIENESTKPAMEDTSMNFPSLPDPRVTSSATSSQPGQVTGSQLRNARDSLDGIHVNRSSVNESTAPGQTTDDTRMTKENEVERAMELSRKEHEELIIAQTLQLSKQEEEVSRRATQDQDPDLARALEASLKDPHLPEPDRVLSWQSQGYANVNQRRMTPDEPVGLRNIGNTCYLNSLLQVYYHLPDFRRAIMSFRPPDDFANTSFEQFSYPPAQIPYQRPVIEEAVEGRYEHESPHQIMERNTPQLDQSFDMSLDGEQMIKHPDGTSGMSDNHAEAPQENSAITHAVLFVIELQKLFAAMALGNESCADPTGVAHAMRDPSGNPIAIGAQQDANEFNLLFLDIVERGLKSEALDSQSIQGEKTETADSHGAASPPVTMEESRVSENIIKDMFTLRFRQEVRPVPLDRSGPGEDEARPVTIRQGEASEILVNATAKDYRSLHTGLDDYAFARVDYEMSQSLQDAPPNLEPLPPPEGADINHSRTSPTAVKSVWFTRMPPVVVIYLQRTTFNKETSQAEKVHERYDFPCEISFDRYLEENKEVAIRARSILQRIRSEQEHARAVLEQYKTFPHGQRSLYQNAYITNGVVEMDVSESAAPERTQYYSHPRMTKAEDCWQPRDAEAPEENRESIFDSASRVHARLMESINASSQLFAVEGLSRERVEASLMVLKTVMDHDRKRCDALEAKVRSLNDQEESVYQELDKTKYRLHAVLVHDGAPSGGHYWTFIRNWNTTSGDLTWMRLSDSSVIHVSEEEMLLWSVGGRDRASAYCLIYAVESTLESKYKTGESISEESQRLLSTVRIEEVRRASWEIAGEMQEQEQELPGN